jgi:hypothetical protein
VMEDVNLPERQQEFSGYRITHDGGMIPLLYRNRFSTTTMLFMVEPFDRNKAPR